MGTVNFNYWFEELVSAVNGAETDLLFQQIRSAAIEFCNLSEAWRMDNLPVDIEQGTREYAIEAPISGTEIVKIVQVLVNGCAVHPTSWAALIDQSPAAMNHQGNIKAYVQEYANKVALYPIPNTDIVGGLVCKSAVRPTRIANGMDEEVGKRNFDAILSGAKSRLYLIPGKPWSDGAAGVYHKKLMEEAAQKARTEVNVGHGRVALRTKVWP